MYVYIQQLRTTSNCFQYHIDPVLLIEILDLVKEAIAF